ncbi:hypothetical protein [Rhodopseudomonas palustris]|uniref:hypothetical protein n=1 Tax=Rhodopseudomonas palustris TaxID=1076 RepID=UPI0021F2CFC0|nr:hypothetical protein [Rhodopseudomonas palustris]UYO47824.1 hypothetical protein KQX64_17855 [Rhodopseudomonas palustris]UYO52518.1 hypothetical protein KQX61_18245 [Rhodopseudomonas palustris]
MHSSVFGLSSWCDELPIHQPTNSAGSHELMPPLLVLLLDDEGLGDGATDRAGGADTDGALGLAALTLGALTLGREKAGDER